MAIEFENQIAVITGAARGLGFAVSTLLASRGASVFMVDRDGAKVREAAAALARQGFSAEAFEADVADPSAVDRMALRLENVHGGVDVLVNNAGGWRYGSMNEVTAEDWDWTFDVNLRSVLLASRALVPGMIARGGGRIVNVASTDAYVAKPALMHYAAAKAGVVSLTKSLALELAPHDILVTGVSPGAIATETAKGQSWLAKRIESIPLRRAAEPEDIAEVIAFLASRRNRFVVGETVVANGGMYMV